jgi:DNA-binding HxlR family transcriptional regulator
MLDILHIFHTDTQPHRFVDIQARLQLSPNTLSERLRDLVDAGLLTRTAYNEIPPRVDYEATEKALALAPVFESLQAWAAEHDLKRPMLEAHATA